MNLGELLYELRSRGVRLWVEGDQIHYQAPFGTFSDEYKAALKARRDEVLQLLRPAPTCSSCGRAKFQIRGRVPRCLICDGPFGPEGSGP